MAVLVLTGLVLYLFELRHRKRNGANAVLDSNSEQNGENHNETAESESGHGSETEGEECCGLHLVCDKDSLSPFEAEVVYYDDEELDRFVGRAANDYEIEEIEEFRDVLLTMQPGDLAGWARSVTQRKIELPEEIRDELLLLINEQRSLSKK